MLPFSREVFLRLFEHYNAAIWPAQIIAYGLGALLVVLTLKPRRWSDRAVSAVLAAAWLWMGIVYHMMFFATINWAAWAFGALFVIQGLLFTWTGGVRQRLAFRFSASLYGFAGLAFVALAMAVYPLIGSLTDHSWPRAPMFGVAPCPTVIFTFGMLLLTARPVPHPVLVVPVLWSVIGGMAAWQLDIVEDLVLLPAGVSALCLILWKNRRSAPSRSA